MLMDSLQQQQFFFLRIDPHTLLLRTSVAQTFFNNIFAHFRSIINHAIIFSKDVNWLWMVVTRTFQKPFPLYFEEQKSLKVIAHSPGYVCWHDINLFCNKHFSIAVDKECYLSSLSNLAVKCCQFHFRCQFHYLHLGI